jgi:hypothetical protein
MRNKLRNRLPVMLISSGMKIGKIFKEYLKFRKGIVPLR